MRLGDELVAGQRVADQDGVRLVGIERAVGLVGHAIGAELDAAVEPQRPLDAQDRVAALGERLAFGFGQVLEHSCVRSHGRSNEKPPTGRAGAFSSAPTF